MTHTTATTELGRREEEARRIARAEGFAIIGPSPDWTYFTLDDARVLPAGMNYAGRVLAEPLTIRTHFEWNETRFEGFVS